MSSNVDIFHVIITRFNLPSGGRESRIRHSKNWLKERFKLFETVCLPSVINQSNTDFVWFLYFDANTPEPFKNRALKYQQEHNFISIFWETHLPLKRICNQIRQRAPDSATTLITTRLDNDDALHSAFINGLREFANTHKETSQRIVLNYPNGYTFGNQRLYLHKDESNAFTSLMEPLNNEIRSVRACQHTELDTLGPIHQIGSEPMWLQLIHGRNVSNRIRGYRISRSRLNAGFASLAHELPAEKRWLIVLDNVFYYRWRLGKEWLRKLIKTYVLKKR